MVIRLKSVAMSAVFGIVLCTLLPQLFAENVEANSTFTASLDLENKTGETFDSHTESPAITNTSGAEVPRTNTVDPLSACPDFPGLQLPGTVVKCYCLGNEVFVDGKCQPYTGAVVPAQEDWIYTVEAPVEKYNVTIRDVNCDPTKYRSFNFTKGQFHMRSRGDMVLLKGAGELEGQRINNYCLIHHLDPGGDQTWTMKACVPIPSIPVCCPFGYAMKEGSCQPAKTPKLLLPPVLANPSGSHLNWPGMKNYRSELTCDSEPMKTIPIAYKKSNLVSLADGVKQVWTPDGTRRRVYYPCPEYCVDGIENADGSIDYFASFCYQDPKEAHERACQKGPCFRKCCAYGSSMDVHRNMCVPDKNANFSPPVATDLTSYNIAIGYPLCNNFAETGAGLTIDSDGRLDLQSRQYPPSDFCVDTFLDKDHREHKALACGDGPPAWIRVKSYLLPVCKFISLFFLSITIACHLLVPRLMADGGSFLLCYAISLCVAFATSFSVNVFHEYLGDSSCVNLALAMQFGFIATFVWLNVMCFEIWRKIRCLANHKFPTTYSNGFYMLYGWGIPLSISIVTSAMQHLAPDNVYGLVKPYIGISRCWFRDDIGTLLYFYGPISIVATGSSLFLGLTYMNYKTLVRNFMKIGDAQRNKGEEAGSDKKIASPKLPPAVITSPIQDFSTKLKLFSLLVFCWITEVLSWKIPPMELWALTDILNGLQGLLIFIIFLLNRHKRALVEERFPLPFNLVRSCLRLKGKPTVKQDNKSPQEQENSTSSTISIDLQRQN
ncbi:uncharacterized protein [Palaemon carinicauda]|uniref:uncharacterized protein n=1 Tax=Palaemon carinicauda TaxID=392227 RepID=UPI0035B5A33A